MGVTELTSYLILSYFAHTAAGIGGDLIPVHDPKKARLIREWLSSAFGVSLAFSTGVNLIADVGVSIVWPPAGLILTGILMGQGVKFGMNFLRQTPTLPNGKK